MALDASQIYVAGTGHIYTGAEDAAMPPAGSAPPAAWTEHGYTTEDAVEFTFGKTTDALKGWQSFDTLRMLTTEAPKSVKFTLMQSNAENLMLALGGGEVDDSTGIYTPPDPSQIDIRALYISAVDGGDEWTFWAPRVMLSDNVVIPWKKSGEAQLPLTFSIQAADPAFQFGFPTSWTNGGSIAATGAIEGAPGSFTPSGASPPLALAGLAGVTASPVTAWSTGSYVRLGDSSDAHWDGSAWVAGQAT